MFIFFGGYMYKKSDDKKMYLIKELYSGFKDGWHEMVCGTKHYHSMRSIDGHKIEIYYFRFYEPSTKHCIDLTVHYRATDYKKITALKEIYDSWFNDGIKEISLDSFLNKKCKMLTKKNTKTGDAELLKFAPLN